jgi:hypothetical protein
VRKFASQALMTASLAFMTALAISLIDVIDRPFTGPAAISPDALERVVEMFRRRPPRSIRQSMQKRSGWSCV